MRVRRNDHRQAARDRDADVAKAGHALDEVVHLLAIAGSPAFAMQEHDGGKGSTAELGHRQVEPQLLVVGLGEREVPLHHDVGGWAPLGREQEQRQRGERTRGDDDGVSPEAMPPPGIRDWTRAHQVAASIHWTAGGGSSLAATTRLRPRCFAW